MSLLERGMASIRFSSVNLLLEAKNDDLFDALLESINCIIIFAEVKEGEEIEVLMNFFNGIRKVSSKHINVSIYNLPNTTLLEKIVINYEVTIQYKNTGSIYSS